MTTQLKKKAVKTLALLFVSAILLCCFFGCNSENTDVISDEDYSRVTNPVTEPADNTSSSHSEPVLRDNPINFEELNELNPDLYAWIRVPGTVIDYPVAQSEVSESDNFYLHHDYLGNYKFAGTIYSQRHNTKYFIDRVTVFYGHNMLDGSMFAALHKFSNPEFFEENKYIYIYTKGHILTYEIFAAFEYDNRHLMNSFDFSDDEIYSQYLEDCLNPRYANSIVREGTELTLDDRLLVLSTCTNYDSSKRFLVHGVLIDDERTN